MTKASIHRLSDLALAVQDDPSRSDELWDACKAIRRHMLKKYRGHHCEDEVQSAINLAFVQATNRFDRSKAPFGYFFMQLIDKQLIDEFRRQTSSTRVPLGGIMRLGVSDDRIESKEHGPHFEVDREDQRKKTASIVERAIDEVLRGKPKETKQILLLAMEGTPSKEIAEIVGLPLERVRYLRTYWYACFEDRLKKNPELYAEVLEAYREMRSIEDDF